jgi:hypothetical protein
MHHGIDPCHESDAQLQLIEDLESNQPAGKILTTMYYKSVKNKKVLTEVQHAPEKNCPARKFLFVSKQRKQQLAIETKIPLR